METSHARFEPLSTSPFSVNAQRTNVRSELREWLRIFRLSKMFLAADRSNLRCDGKEWIKPRFPCKPSILHTAQLSSGIWIGVFGVACASSDPPTEAQCRSVCFTTMELPLLGSNTRENARIQKDSFSLRKSNCGW